MDSGSASSEGMKYVRSALRLFLMIVFIGYIMVWIMMPTNTFYLHWLPNIHAKTDSTYFGKQGANMLIYTFPILFIATLGCLYLHLGKKNVDSDTERNVENSRLASWKRPVLVKGPLGIVSWIELSFLTMFIGMLVWSFASYLHGMFANVTQQAAHEGEHVKEWEANLESSALMLGLIGNIYTSNFTDAQMADKIGISNVAGEVALLAGIVMCATSFSSLRRKIFELFFYTHHLYIIFLVSFVLHVEFSYSCIMLPGFYLFLIDRYLRFLQSQLRVRLVSARVLPCEAVELTFSKNPGLSYTPTSSVFINVPSISKLQWHPFTITSSSKMDLDKLSVIIKSNGSWSQKMYQMLSSPSPMDRMEVSIEGPYGPPSTHFLKHDMLVMVSGGSGITPFISIIRELLFRSNTKGGKTPRVLLICAFKKSLDLTMLQLLFPVSGTNLDTSCLQLQIEAYMTREREPTTDDQKLLQTIWFKPNALDAPISAVLGTNNWLWLAAIISSSFPRFPPTHRHSHTLLYIPS
ncbi:hypothetical protein SLA2020_495920 [Shorea laevis]